MTTRKDPIVGLGARLRSTGSISRGSFQIYFSAKPLPIQPRNLESRCRVDFTVTGLRIKI